jgi:hypothetical protein
LAGGHHENPLVLFYSIHLFLVFILFAYSAPIAPSNVDADGAALKRYDPS